MTVINSNHLIVTSDPDLIDSLWKNEDAVLLERHCDKNGIPVSEEWLVPSSFWRPGEGLRIGQKTA